MSIPPIEFQRWAWNNDNKGQPKPPEVSFLDGYQFDNSTGLIDGLVIKWKVNVESEKGLMLSAVTHDAYGLSNPRNISASIIRQIFNKSYWRMKEAFEKRFEEDGYKTSLWFDADPKLLDLIADKIRQGHK